MHPEFFQKYSHLSPGELFCLREEEKLRLKKQSTRAGLCVISFLLIQNVLSLFIGFIPSLNAAYFSDSVLPRIIEMTLYLSSMLVPFMVAYILLPEEDKVASYCFDKPLSVKACLAAVVAGTMFCTVGNFATDYFIALLSSFGIELSGGDYSLSETVEDFVFQTINIALLPALVEEFALRCVIMQPLRKYGDKFAIIMSSLVFALMHGNMIQIPFAFVAGLAIGYFVIATRSIWTGVAIHLINNLLSVILSFVFLKDAQAASTFYSAMNAVTLVAGIICFAVFMTLCKREKLKPNPTVLSNKDLGTAYIFTPSMIIAIVLIALFTSQFVEYTGVG
ncbi:MAG: CPBP family intramembrane metalloprotease [Clostridia bacterium]|nr:CPBP family intramembrane metalloprotease [Clostridia bacterium]